jgi:ferredoxin-type protein NapH
VYRNRLNFKDFFTNRFRIFTQTISTIFFNLPFLSFFLKRVPMPVLHCYSCPLATGACPVGTIQHLIVVRDFPFYTIGFISLIYIFLGKLSCGFMCPFGFFQDLLFKIKTKFKIKPKITYLFWTKYGFLIFLVIIGPLITNETLFCKICPAGTLTAGIPQVIINPSLRNLIGPLYISKILILFFLSILFIFEERPFCHYFCPLGGFIGVFNKFSYLKIEVDTEKCIECFKCEKVCPFSITTFKDPDNINCIRCGKCIDICPTKALSFKFTKNLYNK